MEETERIEFLNLSDIREGPAKTPGSSRFIQRKIRVFCSLHRFSSYGSMAQIAEGDIIADGELTFINKKGQIESASIYSLITNKRVLILGFTGAFFSTCR